MRLLSGKLYGCRPPCASSPPGATPPAPSRQGDPLRQALAGSVRGSEKRRATDAVPPLCLLHGPQQRGLWPTLRVRARGAAMPPTAAHNVGSAALESVHRPAVARESRARASDGRRQRRGASCASRVAAAVQQPPDGQPRGVTRHPVSAGRLGGEDAAGRGRTVRPRWDAARGEQQR
eukprot:5389056-Prymnesium_polylepis.1